MFNYLAASIVSSKNRKINVVEVTEKQWGFHKENVHTRLGAMGDSGGGGYEGIKW